MAGKRFFTTSIRNMRDKVNRIRIEASKAASACNVDRSSVRTHGHGISPCKRFHLSLFQPNAMPWRNGNVLTGQRPRLAGALL
jgi:hypothetical protein